MSGSPTHRPVDGRAHHLLLRSTIDRGYPFRVAELARALSLDEPQTRESLARLAANHGVVLHPHGGEVWLVHPFSTTPTLFWVHTVTRGWWAPCIWCAFGVATLVAEAVGDVVVATTLGGEAEPCRIACTPDRVEPRELLAHFPIPVARAWDNVHEHCAKTLVFRDEPSIDAWCTRHGIAKGEVLPLARVHELARRWYGRHLDPDWRKPTVDEARALFERCGLTSKHWALAGSGKRF